MLTLISVHTDGGHPPHWLLHSSDISHQKFLLQCEHLHSTQTVVAKNRFHFFEHFCVQMFLLESFILNHKTPPLAIFCDEIHISCLFRHPLTHMKLILARVNSTLFKQNVADWGELN